MKIKHWAGYGSVNYKKVEDRKDHNEYGKLFRKVVFKLWGNHEQGLIHYYSNEDDFHRWIGHRVVKDGWKPVRYSYTTGYEKVDGLDTEVATLELIYREV